MTKERLAAQNLIRVQRQKDETIQQEIKLITKRQHEAVRLEKHEHRIIKRLKETHVKQQETIAQIHSMIGTHTPLKHVAIAGASD
jgi:hypothetical protein